MDELFEIENPDVTPQDTPESFTGFKYCELQKGEIYTYKNIPDNVMVFLSSGELVLNYEQYSGRIMNSSHCILIPKGAVLSVGVREHSFVLLLLFDVLESLDDKYLVDINEAVRNVTLYSFLPTRMKFPLTNFTEQIIYYLKTGLNSAQLAQIKEKEFVIILRSYYTIEENAHLFYPLFSDKPDFRNFILRNYMKVKSVPELVRLSGMCRTNFEHKFKEVFHASPHKWLLKQMANKILTKASEPDVTINDIMKQFNFNSATHFNRFCKQQFNCTPGQLIKKNQSR